MHVFSYHSYLNAVINFVYTYKSCLEARCIDVIFIYIYINCCTWYCIIKTPTIYQKVVWEDNGILSPRPILQMVRRSPWVNRCCRAKLSQKKAIFSSSPHQGWRNLATYLPTYMILMQQQQQLRVTLHISLVVSFIGGINLEICMNGERWSSTHCG